MLLGRLAANKQQLFVLYHTVLSSLRYTILKYLCSCYTIPFVLLRYTILKTFVLYHTAAYTKHTTTVRAIPYRLVLVTLYYTKVSLFVLYHTVLSLLRYIMPNYLSSCYAISSCLCCAILYKSICLCYTISSCPCYAIRY